MSRFFGQERSLGGWCLTALALLATACGKDAVVDGSCKKGLTECNLKCVDIEQDPANCGACGRQCPSGATCSAGTCSGADASVDVEDDASFDVTSSDVSLVDTAPTDTSSTDVDASSTDTSTTDTSTTDTSTTDTSTTDTSTTDTSTTDTSTADTSTADADASRDGDGATDGPTCMPPYNTPEHCGDCDTKCTEATPLCGLDGVFKCVARCDPPLVTCGTVCVDTNSDEKNCGGCGNVCPSGICQAGGCVGKGYGHEVVIGTDYSDATLDESSAQVTMLGNAIFQNVAPAVRVLAYDEFADSATVARIAGWISSMATMRGKSVTMVQAPTFTLVPQQLTVQQYQVLLVYDQARAAADQMATTGTLWNAAMNAFAKGGGIVVALDGGSAGQMKDFLSNGGLLAVTAETDVTGTQLRVDAPTDVVGQNLPNVFAAKRTTVAFTTTQMRDNYHVYVVTDMTGMLPVVVHSVPMP